MINRWCNRLLGKRTTQQSLCKRNQIEKSNRPLGKGHPAVTVQRKVRGEKEENNERNGKERKKKKRREIQKEKGEGMQDESVA
jgi:hypothetical protein